MGSTFFIYCLIGLMLFKLASSDAGTVVARTEREMLTALADDEIAQIVIANDITFSQAEWDKYPRPLQLNRSVSIVGASIDVLVDMSWLKARLAIGPTSRTETEERYALEFRNLTFTRVRSPASLTMAGIDLVFSSPGSLQSYRDVLLIADACTPMVFLPMEGPRQERPASLPNAYGNLTQYVSLWPGGWCLPGSPASPARCWPEAGRLEDFGLVALAFGRTGVRTSSGAVWYNNCTYVCRSVVPMSCFVPSFDMACFQTALKQLGMWSVEQVDLTNVNWNATGTGTGMGSGSPGAASGAGAGSGGSSGGGGEAPLEIILPVTIVGGLVLVAAVAVLAVWLLAQRGARLPGPLEALAGGGKQRALTTAAAAHGPPDQDPDPDKVAAAPGVPPSQGSSFSRSIPARADSPLGDLGSKDGQLPPSSTLPPSDGSEDPTSADRAAAPAPGPPALATKQHPPHPGAAGGGLLSLAATALANGSSSSSGGRPTSSPPATPKAELISATHPREGAVAPTPTRLGAHLLLPPAGAGAGPTLGSSPFGLLSTTARFVSRAGSSNAAIPAAGPGLGVGGLPSGHSHFPVSACSESASVTLASGGTMGGQSLDAVITTTTPVNQSIDMHMVLGRDVVLIEDAVRGVGAFGKVVEGILRPGAAAGVGMGGAGGAGAGAGGEDGSIGSGGGGGGGSGGVRVAVKVLRGLAPTISAKEMESMRKEVEVLSRCRHANIVRLLGGNLTPGPQMFLVEELMSTSLDVIIHNHNRGDHDDLPLERVLHIGRDVALGLAYLHPTVVHRDLKPANVLLDEQGTAKLSDFGLARLTAATLHTTSPEVGSVPYMAPECFGGGTHDVSHRSDIYALGVLLWEMLSRVRPWAGQYHIKVALAVSVRGERLPMSAIEQRAPRKLCKLIEECWHEDPYRRPAALDVAKRLTFILQQQQQQHLPPGAPASAVLSGSSPPQPPPPALSTPPSAEGAAAARPAVPAAAGYRGRPTHPGVGVQGGAEGGGAADATQVAVCPASSMTTGWSDGPDTSGQEPQRTLVAPGQGADAAAWRGGAGPGPGAGPGGSEGLSLPPPPPPLPSAGSAPGLPVPGPPRPGTCRPSSSSTAAAPSTSSAGVTPSLTPTPGASEYDSLADSLADSQPGGGPLMSMIKGATLRRQPEVWTPPAAAGGSGSEGRLVRASGQEARDAGPPGAGPSADGGQRGAET